MRRYGTPHRVIVSSLNCQAGLNHPLRSIVVPLYSKRSATFCLTPSPDQGMSKVSSGPLTPCPSPREGEGQGVRAARRPHDFAHALQPRPTLTWPYPKMRYNSHVAFT